MPISLRFEPLQPLLSDLSLRLPDLWYPHRFSSCCKPKNGWMIKLKPLSPSKPSIKLPENCRDVPHRKQFLLLSLRIPPMPLKMFRHWHINHQSAKLLLYLAPVFLHFSCYSLSYNSTLLASDQIFSRL